MLGTLRRFIVFTIFTHEINQQRINAIISNKDGFPPRFLNLI
jgi:hypothetical protein